MKKTTQVLMAVLMLLMTSTQAQVGIGISAASMDASAQLEVKSTAKGLLPPRMTEAQRNSIVSPAAGLILWCSNCGTSGELQVYNGTAWTNLVGGTAATKPLEIGDEYLGGKLAYILQQGDPGYDANVKHGLIAASQDLGVYSWYNGSYVATGATLTAIGSGLANSNLIITVQGSTASYAAKACRDYRGGGYADWYLPSKDELNKLYMNRISIGGFTLTTGYWSSSEDAGNPTNFAWWQNFGNAFQQAYYKMSHSVRAVRSF